MQQLCSDVERIRGAVRHPTDARPQQDLLDRCIVNSVDLVAGHGPAALLAVLADPNDKNSDYTPTDVLVRDIVCASTPYTIRGGSENDVTTHGPITWREAMHLVGEPWSNGVIEYFETAINDRRFPAEGATNRLLLTQYVLSGSRGPVVVDNAKHRAVGLVNWLLASQGGEAIARQALVYNQQLNVECALQILEIAKERDVYAKHKLGAGLGQTLGCTDRVIAIGNLSDPELYQVEVTANPNEWRLNPINPPGGRGDRWSPQELGDIQKGFEPNRVAPEIIHCMKDCLKLEMAQRAQQSAPAKPKGLFGMRF